MKKEQNLYSYKKKQLPNINICFILTKCNPAKVSAPYSLMNTGLLYFSCHSVTSVTIASAIKDVFPVFWYQPWYLL